MWRDRRTGSTRGGRIRPLTGQGVDGRQILTAIALAIFASLVQEGTVSIMALLIAEEGGTVFRRTVLGPMVRQYGDPRD
jgi:hypothetical protein